MTISLELALQRRRGLTVKSVAATFARFAVVIADYAILAELDCSCAYDWIWVIIANL